MAVEKLRIPEIVGILGDRKCLRDSRTSFIEPPDAISFLRIFREGVFQRPRLFTIAIILIRVEVLELAEWCPAKEVVGRLIGAAADPFQAPDFY